MEEETKPFSPLGDFTLQEKLCLIYVTYPSIEEAECISAQLLSQKLVACANILPSSQSLYFWEGQMEKSSENIVLYKTTSQLFMDVEKEIQQLHSYDCPCILQLDVNNSHFPFAQWISDNTSK